MPTTNLPASSVTFVKTGECENEKIVFVIFFLMHFSRFHQTNVKESLYEIEQGKTFLW